MKKIVQGSVLGLVSLAMTGVVFAHVTVNPKETVPGYSVATVRVPNEKDAATVVVRVVVPEGVTVGGVMPIPGWTHAEKRELDPKKTPVMHDDGDTEPAETITEVTWSGGKIGAGEFMEFPLSVQYSADAGKVTWKAYQTYAGGEVVAWDGSSDKSPIPIVTVLKEATEKSKTGIVQMNTSADAGATTWLSVVAVVLSVAAFAKSMNKKK